jgi:predicted DNA-binding protein (MmcQ/YjbR family)
MDITALHQLCLGYPGCEETMPFGPDTLVFKVMGKAYALLSLDAPEGRINLKCDPERALDLREQYPGLVLPGYHMNKKHWNTLLFDCGLTDRLVRELVAHSYDLVCNGLPARDKAILREEKRH